MVQAFRSFGPLYPWLLSAEKCQRSRLAGKELHSLVAFQLRNVSMHTGKPQAKAPHAEATHPARAELAELAG